MPAFFLSACRLIGGSHFIVIVDLQAQSFPGAANKRGSPARSRYDPALVRLT
jgi:hypothetical protein